MPPPTAAARYAGLDALRALAMLLGVLFHAGLSYVVLPIGWTVRDRSATPAFDVACWLIHGFHLHLFFILSGFFARLVWQRDGARGFVANRVRRILVPLVIAWPFTFAATAFVLYRAALSGSYVAPHPALGVPRSLTFPEALSPMHLWYLYYLLIFYAAVVLIAWGRDALGWRSEPAPTSRARWLVASRPSPFLLAVPTAVTLLPMRLLTPDTPYTFVPSPRILAAYAPFLAYGWWLHRDPTILDDLERRAWERLALAGALVPGLVFLLARLDPTTLAPAAPWRGLAEYASALFTWSICTALIGLCTRYYAAPNPTVRAVADASYWVYLVHLPVVAFLQMTTATLAWPAPIKYALLVAAPAFVLSLASRRLLAGARVRTTAA